MRVRSLLTVLGVATLFAGLTVMPAAAGTGYSTWCNDGGGYREIPIVTSPVTIGVEIEHPPGTQHQKIFICYSDTAEGQPSGLTGGVMTLDVWTTDGVSVLLLCSRDGETGIAPECAVPAGVTVNLPNVVEVSTPESTICLLSVGSGCALFAPGLKIVTGGNPEPLVTISLPGREVPVSMPVTVPQHCVALVVTCP